LLFCPVCRAEQAASPDDDRFAALIEQIKPAVVAVGTYYFNDKPKNQYLGTGFVIGNGRQVVTNYHVVQPVQEQKKLAFLRIFHSRFSGKALKAKILAVDEFHDLAILGHDAEALPALKLADSSIVKEGFKVAFTGYPIGFILGLNPTTHTGIISSIAPMLQPSPAARIIDGSLIRHLEDPYEVFQIDATAYPGNSGSPVYRMSSGEVVGVINKVFVRGKKEHILTEPTGITYAIPARFVSALEKTISPFRQ
jgi:S1-C subfamily serine protease